jgi:hypothetical protein
MGYLPRPTGGGGDGTGGAVSSVNGKTGAVKLIASDLGAADVGTVTALQTDMSQAQTDIAELRINGGGGSGTPGSLALTEIAKSDVVTGDIVIKQIPPTSPINLKVGLVKAYQYIPDGESAVDVVRSYDNTVAGVFEPNDMLVYSSAGTHIKVEFEAAGEDITPPDVDYTLFQFAGIEAAIKEMEIL